jgi:GR25 family glycosyltransferase involved in LPS biosynthesis
MIKIFILHYSKLTERKKCILEQFKRNNISNFEFIEKYDKDEITEEESNIFDKNYKKSTMSLHLKHNYVYKQIAEKYENALIFEDDVILCDNFVKILQLFMYQLPDNYDMLFIGNGCNLHIPQSELIPNKYIYSKCLYPTSWGGDGATRCSDSYIVSNKCAKVLCKCIDNLQNKIKLPIDWWLNETARQNNFKVYWAEPTLVMQGSQNGTYNISH